MLSNSVNAAPTVCSVISRLHGSPAGWITQADSSRRVFCGQSGQAREPLSSSPLQPGPVRKWGADDGYRRLCAQSPQGVERLIVHGQHQHRLLARTSAGTGKLHTGLRRQESTTSMESPASSAIPHSQKSETRLFGMSSDSRVSETDGRDAEFVTWQGRQPAGKLITRADSAVSGA